MRAKFLFLECLSVSGKPVELNGDSESAIIKMTVYYDAPMNMTNDNLIFLANMAM